MKILWEKAGHTWSVWLALGAAVGIAAGLSSAFFLFCLQAVTQYRSEHLSLVYALPFAGLAWGFFHERFGQPVAGGNNLVIDHLHTETGALPWRMTPIVLAGTLLTHLFGGSAGREGTAVQMGASLADGIYRACRRLRPVRSHIMMAGMAGGFGSVFGTPVAGAIFALEMGTIGRTDYAALMPCLTAALVGNWVTHATGHQSAIYPTITPLPLTPGVALAWLVVGLVVAIVAAGFITVSHAIARQRALRLPVRMFFGGVVVVILWRLVGTETYLGLGDATLLQAFTDTHLNPWTWLGKAIFTAITLGSGFLGGEVTPLFFTGATLGNALSGPLHLPVDVSAAVCMVAMFGAAANAPLALMFMAAELMGAAVLPHVAIVTTVAYLLIGSRSIYAAQRLSRDKYSPTPHSALQALRDL